MFTFHSIDTVTGELANKAELNREELDTHMLDCQAKYWACQVVCGVTGNKVVFVIGATDEWVVHHKTKGE